MYYPLFNPKFNTDDIVAEHATFDAGVRALGQDAWVAVDMIERPALYAQEA